MVMDYGRWDPCDFIASPDVRSSPHRLSSRKSYSRRSHIDQNRSFSFAVGNSTPKRNLSISTRHLSFTKGIPDANFGRRRSHSHTFYSAGDHSDDSNRVPRTRARSKSHITVPYHLHTSLSSSNHSHGKRDEVCHEVDGHVTGHVSGKSAEGSRSAELNSDEWVEDQGHVNGKVNGDCAKENPVYWDKMKEKLKLEESGGSRNSSCSSPKVRVKGLSSARATLGCDTLSKRTMSSNSDGSLHHRSFCDEMSCCKSYLGKNNEVKMTSNLPECFFRFVVITTFLAVYMCIGAAIFCEIEREQEKAHSLKMKEHWKRFQEENEISEEMMNKFLLKHYDMCEQGDHNHEDNNVQWDYISSLFFTGTILTTIGYGHSSPSTLGGRLFTIFYAIAGIPFMLGLSNVVAEILLTTLKIMKSKWKKKPYPDVFHVEVFISALCCVVVLLLFMTLIFKWQESEWSYEQSVYFSFITMTTIGFGDFVPAQVNVQNNSPQLIAREFFNLLLILISVLIWYFLSQVSAQVLKVRLKALHQYLRSSSSLFNKTDHYPEVEANHHVDADSDDPEIGTDRCTCNCTCGYHDHITDSASGILDTHSAVSERSGMEPPPMNNLECIKDNDTTNQDDEDDDTESSCSDSSSENSASQSHHNINFVPLSDPVAEPPDASLKIPSIVITPVDPNAKSANNSPKTNPAYTKPCLHHPYDSGKGSSEITTYTCQSNDISNTKTPSQSSSSLSTNSSGVFSDSHSKAGVYVNGGFIPSLPRMKRSKSEEVGSSSYISLSIGSKGIRRISRSLTDLGFGKKPYRYLSEQKLNSIDLNGEVDTFTIHTQVFDDMMKS